MQNADPTILQLSENDWYEEITSGDIPKQLHDPLREIIGTYLSRATPPILSATAYGELKDYFSYILLGEKLYEILPVVDEGRPRIHLRLTAEGFEKGKPRRSSYDGVSRPFEILLNTGVIIVASYWINGSFPSYKGEGWYNKQDRPIPIESVMGWRDIVSSS